MTLGSTQTLTEMSTRNIPGGKGILARKGYNLTAISEPIVLENVEASQTYKPPQSVTGKILPFLCYNSLSSSGYV
jgi:hypothetical protein